ncbi:MAG: aminotransferase class I/II-fold pyridoxal phosphate-dependent enzyme [Actinomycetota bacterium]
MGDPAICDFVFGNPHEMPLPGLVEAIQRHAVPENKDWFAYSFNEPKATHPIAESLASRTGLAFVPEDIFPTPGTFGALAVSMRAIVDPGDEVIFLSPPWFFYESMISILGARPVRVTLRSPQFDLVAEDVRAAITPKTRAIIVNSPHNPTGRIYPKKQLDELAAVLKAASHANGRKIFLLSDESYNRILFDGRSFVGPAASYPDTLTLYTYGKQLLAPGERIGYIALSPSIGDRDDLREALFFSQVVGGWQIPSVTLQRAVSDLEALSIDIGALQQRRDRMAEALTAIGYEVTLPEATFYMMVRSPIPDDRAFTDTLTEHDVFVGPGEIFEMPGYFRISLTANDDMITRSLPGFEAAFKQARG